MKTRRHHQHIIFNVLVLALLGAFWVFFAPARIGGTASYVIVNGNSMEPVYYRGDLVILHAANDYQVGDIVTFRHPDIGPVIHRIIGHDGERWIFKGDNNNFIDPYRPVQSDLIGRAWLHLPNLGKTMVQLRSPAIMTLLVLGVGGIIMTSVAGNATTRRGRKQARRPAGARHPAGPTPNALAALFAIFGALALTALALAAFVFTRPDTREVADTTTYRHTGEFSYSAPVPQGLYDLPLVQSGEPIFRKLTSVLNTSFTYRFESEQPGDLQGTYRLVAEISGANGWKRTVELQPQHAFRGNSFTVDSTVDLAWAQTVIEQLEQQTALKRQQYTLAFVPQVSVEGSIAGQAVLDTFAPRLEFQFDEVQLQLAKRDRNPEDMLKPSKPGQLKHTRTEPNTIALLGLNLEVPLARQISLIGMALSLLGSAVLGVSMRRAVRRDEAARIRLKYGALMIDVAGGQSETSARAIEVTSIEDLAKLAEKHGTMILHEVRDLAHRYTVHDSSVSYYYQFAHSGPSEPSGSAPPNLDVPAPHPMTEPETPQPVGTADRPASAPAHVPPQWQATFLAALRETGRAADACRTVGIPLSTAYRERALVPAFARAWEEARNTAQTRSGGQI